MNIRSLLSLILLFATTFDATLFAAKRSFDEVDDREHSSDNDFCVDDEQEDNKDPKSKPSSKSAKKTYPCDYCDKIYTDRSYLDKHTKTVHEGKTYPCNHCKKEYLYQSSCTKHQKICKHKPSRSQAGPALAPQEALDQETLDSENDNEDNDNEHSSDDDFCDDEDDAPKPSSKSAKKNYRCTICPKRFTSRATCTAHKRTHSGEKPYPCQHCGKTFIDTSGRSKHERVHTGEKPYPCGYCEKAFAHSNDRTRHIGRMHPDSLHDDVKKSTKNPPSNPTTYPCSYCKKEYAYSRSCISHQKKCTQNPSRSQAGSALPLHAAEPALVHVLAPAIEPSLLSDAVTAPAADSFFLTPQETLDQEALGSIDLLFPISTDEIQAFLQQPLPTPLTDSYLLPPYQPSLDPDSLFSASFMQADPNPLPNLDTDDIEDYLRNNS